MAEIEIRQVFEAEDFRAGFTPSEAEDFRAEFTRSGGRQKSASAHVAEKL
ncbi:MAG: hypothetical protein H0T80_16450 [Betaproteobacteria bacterium]|nr:hypothetical protein [Betaproteobacteria bacterium]